MTTFKYKISLPKSQLKKSHTKNQGKIIFLMIFWKMTTTKKKPNATKQGGERKWKTKINQHGMKLLSLQASCKLKKTKKKF